MAVQAASANPKAMTHQEALREALLVLMGLAGTPRETRAVRETQGSAALEEIVQLVNPEPNSRTEPLGAAAARGGQRARATMAAIMEAARVPEVPVMVTAIPAAVSLLSPIGRDAFRDRTR
jgi:hypothetical protein